MKLICSKVAENDRRNELSTIVTHEYELEGTAGAVFVDQVYTDHLYTLTIGGREIFLRAMTRETAIAEAMVIVARTTG